AGVENWLHAETHRTQMQSKISREAESRSLGSESPVRRNVAAAIAKSGSMRTNVRNRPTGRFPLYGIAGNDRVAEVRVTVRVIVNVLGVPGAPGVTCEKEQVPVSCPKFVHTPENVTPAAFAVFRPSRFSVTLAE